MIGPKKVSESYESQYKPLVRKLVNVAGPKLIDRSSFTMNDVINIIGDDPLFDNTVYYKFKAILDSARRNKQAMTETKLMNELVI